MFPFNYYYNKIEIVLIIPIIRFYKYQLYYPEVALSMD